VNIPPPAVRQIDRDLAVAKRLGRHRTRRQAWLVQHAKHGRLEGLDNSDECSCGAVFWRPRPDPHRRQRAALRRAIRDPRV